MRIIKFRAWDKIKKKTVLVDNIEFMPDSNDGEDINHWHDTTRHILMQYTGLKDKNDKEIYEGDVIEAKTNCGEHSFRGIVVWDEFQTRFIVEPLSELPSEGDSRWDLYFMMTGEIIGNKFSNPELLEEK